MTVLDDLFMQISNRKRFMALIILLPTLTALILSLVLPKTYLSQASILPVNSRLSDKARFSSEEIAELYSAFGNGDDLDRLFAAARSASVLMKMVDSFQLVNHYQLSHKKESAREAAVKKLKSSSEIRKTEYGEIQIRVWDTDRQLAADICNAIVEQVDKIHRDLYTTFYARSLNALESEYAEKLLIANDSAQDKISANPAPLFAEELSYYRKSIADNRIALQNPPPSLMVLEKAYVSVKPDKPDLLMNVLVTFLVSAFTGLAAILLLPAGNKFKS